MGVKSLWTLLTPVGRPILLETVEGKAMAIDSSIWIYQFQATMRDKEGRALMNAHVLGFLRRITKLLFYGIKPVFVFDGGAPVLKRSTLNERRKKKSGAVLSHVKIAERLLAAQMRKEALNHTQSKKGKGKARALPEDDLLEDDENNNVVYLEDIDPSFPRTPARSKTTKPTTPPSSSSKKKNKFYDHDPYRLPEINMNETIANVTRSNAPDPRLATEDELRTFIEEMRPEDFDITSPEFRELPTEVQYEIIGDLRLKSRQTSYARLQNMLRIAPTPMDFSKQQIINLKQRNSLTQQLFVTTDSIGNSHLAIPVRIASERNRQYVLTKNEGVDGGWVLAIQDKTGRTADQPILIDTEKEEPKDEDEDEDMDMEEVDTTPVTMDPDLRRHQREMALSAIAGRYSPKKLAPLTTKPSNRKTNSTPLFELSDDEEDEALRKAIEQFEQEDDDEELALAIQASMDQTKQYEQQQHQGQGQGSSSSGGIPGTKTPTKTPTKESTPKSVGFPGARRPSPEVDVFSPTPLETALAFAGTGISRSANTSIFTSPERNKQPSFGTPSLLSGLQSAQPGFSNEKPAILDKDTLPTTTMISGSEALTDSDEEMEEVEVSFPPMPMEPSASEISRDGMEDIHQEVKRVTFQTQSESLSDIDEDMEEVAVSIPQPPTLTSTATHSSSTNTQETSTLPSQLSPLASASFLPPSATLVNDTPLSAKTMSTTYKKTHETPLFVWSRSPSPSQPTTTFGKVDSMMLPLSNDTPSPVQEAENEKDEEHEDENENENEEETQLQQQLEEDHWDAVNEMDLPAEEGEFARFMSQVKGRNLEDVRKEIDDEITVLNEQRKAAMRDSEDITQQMISQIQAMLRLFGIPYITAPMEAEAQCAELVTLGLVDGVITDDSDVFLFGAQRVYKNMFNQSKTVELFLSSDLERELGLDRDTLVRLAYLLGSDYTEGLGGVGPVMAMELLKEFPGKDGLHKFADWWRRVQEGKDKQEESKNKFRRQFKKKFKDLYLQVDWPDPAVRDAYYHPAVDNSEEPFKWGLPDLDALRTFFKQELGWGQTKVDELLLPVIQKMSKRRINPSGTTSGMQGSLSEWVTVTSGNNQSVAGNMAPRKKEVYTSKRLQQVVAEFRKRRASGTPSRSGSGSGSGSEKEGREEDGDSEPLKKRQRKTKKDGTTGGTRGGRGRGKGAKTAQSKRKSKAKDDDEFVEEGVAEEAQHEVEDEPSNKQVRPKPRPTRKQKTPPIVDPPEE